MESEGLGLGVEVLLVKLEYEHVVGEVYNMLNCTQQPKRSLSMVAVQGDG